MYGQRPHGYGTQFGSPQIYPEAQRHKRTALDDLDAFLAGLPADEKQSITGAAEFAEPWGRFVQGFLSFLLIGEAGARFIESVPGAPEQAERLLLAARNIHQRSKEESRGEVERLRRDLAEARARLAAQSGNAKGVKHAE